MKLFFVVVGILVTAQVHAAALECHLPSGTAVIESTVLSLKLSNDGKELVQTVALGRPASKLIVDSYNDVNGVLTVSGTVQSLLACAGSCGVSTFTLTVSGEPNERMGNATLVRTGSRFDESKGGDIPFNMSWKYVCVSDPRR